MKRFRFIVMMMYVVMAFTACTTLQPISFERLQPASVSFPEQVRKVGVVGYVSQAENEAQATGLKGDRVLAAESLAQEIAETHYFDQVIISDSILPDQPVDHLIQTMDVDMLFVMEQIDIQLMEGTLFLPELMLAVPAIDAAVTPLIRVYTQKRKTPLFTVSKTDTISWEYRPDLTQEQVVKEASEYAAVMSMNDLLPYWEEIHRCYYDGGSVEMRDAGVYLREQEWERAASLWEKVYAQKKGKSKMRAAFNLAVFHESQGNFEKAKEYLDAASRLAGEGTSDDGFINYYQLQLESQASRNLQLKLQMKRFE